VKPVYFGPDERPLFGWLHQAAGTVGLVVCNPFGYEAVCAQRSLRYFCEGAASGGFPALRFDYDGTGDSAGDDRDPGRVAAWVGSVHHAVDALKRLTGVERVVVLGVRLGALLAARAAMDRTDIAGLVAIAPVIAGKAYLRELRALQMALGHREPPPDAVVDKQTQEALGFPITDETKQALTAIDLLTLPKPPAPAVLLLERNDLPSVDAWPDRLAALSVNVERLRIPGYVEMMLDPEFVVVPHALIQATVAWMAGRGTPQGATPSVTREPAPSARVSATVVERAEFVSETHGLFGVLSTPVTPPAARRGLLLLNAGAIGRGGPNRLYVALARRWAALGHAVLRVDVSGIGDSFARGGDRENVVYTRHAGQDIADAVAFLRRQPGVTEVHALGLCSGGYHAFKAAVAGLKLEGVLLINPLTFFFKPDQPADAADYKVGFTMAHYSKQLFDPEAWKRALRGKAKVRPFVQALVRRGSQMVRDRVRNLARHANFELEDDLASELSALARRDIPVRFLFAANDPGLAILRAQGGDTVDKLERSQRLTIQIIEGPDHTFTPVWSHAALVAALAAHFDELPR